MYMFLFSLVLITVVPCSCYLSYSSVWPSGSLISSSKEGCVRSMFYWLQSLMYWVSFILTLEDCEEMWFGVRLLPIVWLMLFWLIDSMVRRLFASFIPVHSFLRLYAAPTGLFSCDMSEYWLMDLLRFAELLFCEWTSLYRDWPFLKECFFYPWLTVERSLIILVICF